MKESAGWTKCVAFFGKYRSSVFHNSSPARMSSVVPCPLQLLTYKILLRSWGSCLIVLVSDNESVNTFLSIQPFRLDRYDAPSMLSGTFLIQSERHLFWKIINSTSIRASSPQIFAPTWPYPIHHLKHPCISSQHLSRTPGYVHCHRCQKTHFVRIINAIFIN